MWKNIYKRLILFLSIALLGLCSPIFFHFYAQEQIRNIHYAENEQLALEWKKNYLMLYYAASGYDTSAVFDPNVQLPTIIKDSLINQLDQYCYLIDTAPDEYFYYRIVNDENEEVKSNFQAIPKNTFVSLLVTFDADGNASYKLNNQQVQESLWALSTGVEEAQQIYQTMLELIDFANLGIYDSQQQLSIKNSLYEALRQPIASNVTYQVYIPSTSLYVQQVIDATNQQIFFYEKLFMMLFLIACVTAGIFCFYKKYDPSDSDKHIFWIGRHFPLLLQVCILTILFMSAQNTNEIFSYTDFSYQFVIEFIVFGMLTVYLYINLLMALRSYDRDDPFSYLCRYAILAKLFYRYRYLQVYKLFTILFFALLFVILLSFAMLSLGWIGIVTYSLFCVFTFYVTAKTYTQFCREYNDITDFLCHRTLPLSKLSIFSRLKSALDQNHLLFQQAVDEEVRSQKMKSELITNVSHDLKTPLTSIRGYIDLLKKEELTPQEQMYTEKIAYGIERLTHLVEDLMDVSRADSGNLTLHLASVKIDELIQQVILEHERALKKRKLSIRIEKEENAGYIYADPEKTYRIFDNLIGNCVKYAMPDTRIYVVYEMGDNNISICVKNISAHEIRFDAREILHRFVRGETSRTSEGSGLGLAIVRSFAQAQNGCFHVEVDGDLFKAIVSLPIRKENQADREESKHE